MAESLAGGRKTPSRWIHKGERECCEGWAPGSLPAAGDDFRPALTESIVYAYHARLLRRQHFPLFFLEATLAPVQNRQYRQQGHQGEQDDLLRVQIHYFPSLHSQGSIASPLAHKPLPRFFASSCMASHLAQSVQ